MEIFHGGCLGCVQQDINGRSFCANCRYFKADWSLHNLSIYDMPSKQIKSIPKLDDTDKYLERIGVG